MDEGYFINRDARMAARELREGDAAGAASPTAEGRIDRPAAGGLRIGLEAAIADQFGGGLRAEWCSQGGDGDESKHVLFHGDS